MEATELQCYLLIKTENIYYNICHTEKIEVYVPIHSAIPSIMIYGNS